MAVLLSDCRLGVRRQLAGAVDGHGDRRPGGWAALVGPWPGRAAEGPDAPGPVDATSSREWTLAVDPAGWPIRRGDLVAEVAGREWLVLSADLLPNGADPSVSYVKVKGHIRTGAGDTKP
ncbi:MAG: hypothetical protein JWL97_4229 [Gemmatimonadales bacterium]|nr:hypothetical protein [Gemmatimonadales bacterium]